jgi:hypothetical protein
MTLVQVQKALQNPESADFTALRQAYAESPEHDPYAQKGELPSALARLREAVSSGDDRRVAAEAEAVLALNPTFLRAHLAASAAYERLGDAVQAERLRRFVQGWLDALAAAGDGRSMETAFPVLSLDEEYALLQVAGWEPVGRRAAEENGHIFDIFEARRLEDGTLAVVCFNIDLISRSVREGRGVLPPSDEPEVRLQVTQPGHHRLRLTLEFTAPETEGTVRARIGRYLEGNGYRKLNDARYSRGSRWGSLASLSPRGWQAIVTDEVRVQDGKAHVRAFFDINTFGQQVISPEVEFWQAEAGGLAKAILTGHIDTGTSVAYAGRARRAGIIAAIGLVAFLIVASLLIAATKLGISEAFDRWLPGLKEPLAGLSSNNPIIVAVFLTIVIAYVAISWWRRRKR